jgi:hypothetical protein
LMSTGLRPLTSACLRHSVTVMLEMPTLYFPLCSGSKLAKLGPKGTPIDRLW